MESVLQRIAWHHSIAQKITINIPLPVKIHFISLDSDTIAILV